jgi:hypothetical protein
MGDADALDELCLEEMVHDIETHEEPNPDDGPSVVRSPDDILEDICFIGYSTNILNLALHPGPAKCTTCDAVTAVSASTMGTAINLVWVNIKFNVNEMTIN